MAGANKGNYPFPFGDGIDTKTGKQVGNKLLALENGWFAKGGEISKRWGFVSKGTPDNVGLGDNFVLLDDELAVASGGSLYSYDSQNSAWRSKGVLQTVGVAAKSIVQTAQDQLWSDVASTGGITVYAYESGGAANVSVVDEASGAVLANRFLGAGGTPRCVAYGGVLYIFWVGSAVVAGKRTIFYNTVTPATPTTVSAPVTFETDLDSVFANYAVAANVNIAAPVLAYIRNAVDGSKRIIVKDVLHGAEGTFSDIFPATALDICVDSAGVTYVAGVIGPRIYFKAFNRALQGMFVEQWVNPSAAAIPNITLASSAAHGADIYFEVGPGAGPANNTSTWTFAITDAGASTTTAVVARSVGLGSRAFVPGTIPRVGTLGTAVVLAYDSALQATDFLWLKGPGIVARFVAGKGGGLTSKPFLSSVVSLGGTKFAAALGTKGPLQSLPSNTLTTIKTAARVTLDFAQRYRNAQLGRTAVAAGGQIQQYDGSTVAELGFNVFPEQATVSQSPATAFTLIQAENPATKTPMIVQMDVAADSVALASSGGGAPAGVLYTPASYFILSWAADTNENPLDWYLWFTVDGVGVDPVVIFRPNEFGVNQAGVQIALLSTDKQSVVAAKIATAVNSVPNQHFTATSTDTYVTITTALTHASYLSENPPIEGSRFGVWKIVAAADSSTSERYRFTCIAGNRIKAGQYFTYASSYTAGAAIEQKYLFYFVVDSIAPTVVPTIVGCIASIPVAVNLTDTAAQVATALSTAVTGVTFGGVHPFALAYLVGPAVAFDSHAKTGTVATAGIFLGAGANYNNTASGAQWTRKIRIDFGAEYTVTYPFDLPTHVGSANSVASAIGLALAGVATTSVVGGQVQITSNTTGAGSNVEITGGTAPQGYDGFSANDQGVRGADAQLFATMETPRRYSVGGEMEAGQREYFPVYAWTDAKGLRHRSAPGIGAVAVAAEGNNSHFITVPTLRLTKKTGVQIEVYRTSAGVATAQLIKTLDNNPTVDSLSFWDALSDADLASAEFLYTTGGILPNVCPPPAQTVCQHHDRLFLSGLDDRNILWYSKQYVDGTGVAFSDLLTLRFDDFGGDITALATMDDKLIVFKRRRIYFIAGDGPNALGQQDTFSDPQVINTGVGCISPESVVFTPNGLMFQSERGLHLLSRDLQTSDLGAEIEDFVTSLVTSAVLALNSTRIQFTFASGNAVHYDYHFNQWGTATDGEAEAGVVWNSLYCLIRPNGNVWLEAPGVYSDAGASYALKIQTPWFKPAGIQGFWRAQKFSFLGAYEGPHVMQVEAAYDYEDLTTDTYLFDPTAVLAGGLPMPLGGGIGDAGPDTSVYQFEAQFARQKCEAIRLTFTDIVDPAGDSLGNTYIVANLNFGIAVEDSSYRFPASRRTG